MQEREVVADMAVFVAIVDSGSLAGAAVRTGLTPSAVSKLLSRLERRFGSPLVRRTTRRMTVTDAGQMFYERSQRILDDLRAVEQEMASKNSEPRGLVRVSASLLLGQARVLPILLAFLKKTPLLSMELELSDRIVDLVAERVDVAIRVTGEPPPSFVARRVGTVKRVLCASPAYLRAGPVLRTPADLGAHNCLLLTTATRSESWRFGPRGRGTRQETVRVSGAFRVSNTLALHEGALAGLGIAELPSFLVEADLKACRLVSVLADFETRSSDVFVVYAAGRLLPTRVRTLVEHLVPALAHELGETGGRVAKG
jgi:LysR family transcriptional regulator, transcriptional activator for dmlA